MRSENRTFWLQGHYWPIMLINDKGHGQYVKVSQKVQVLYFQKRSRSDLETDQIVKERSILIEPNRSQGLAGPFIPIHWIIPQ